MKRYVIINRGPFGWTGQCADGQFILCNGVLVAYFPELIGRETARLVIGPAPDGRFTLKHDSGGDPVLYAPHYVVGGYSTFTALLQACTRYWPKAERFNVEVR